MLNIASDVPRFVESLLLTPKEVMNDVDLCVWVADAQPGDRIVYYTGHLSRDRLPHRDGYADAIRRKINELGNAAWMLGAENWLHLVQRRVSYGCWDYIAVRKAETPKLKPVYRIIQSLAREPGKGKGEKLAAAEVMVVDGGTQMATGPPA
jgi:hypothetical protein